MWSGTWEAPKIGLGEWFLEQLRRNAKGDEIAQVCADDGTTWTYSKLLQDSVQFAAGLQALGAKSGDVASIIMNSTHEIHAVFIACLLCDILVATPNVYLHADVLCQCFRMLKPTFVFTTPNFRAVVHNATKKSGLEHSSRVITLDSKGYMDILALGKNTDLASFQPVKITNPKHQACICVYTRGLTTGVPKGVTLTHYGFLKSMYRGRYSDTIARDPGPYLQGSPLSWTWSGSLSTCLMLRKTRIFVTQSTYVNILDSIDKYKVATFCATPKGVLFGIETAVDKNPGRWHLSSLKFVVATGDKLDAEMQANLAKKLDADIYQLYGGADSGVVLCGDVNRPVVLGSVGTPALTIKVIDPITEKDVTEPYTPGEIRVQKPVMKEYIGNPAATKESFDKDGWFKTGDLVYFNENGEFFYVDVLKKDFKSHGLLFMRDEAADSMRLSIQRAELDIAKNLNARFQKQLAAAKAELSNQRIESEAVKNPYASLMQRLSAAEAQLSNQQTESETVKNLNASLQQRLAEAEAELSNQQTESETVKNLNASLQQRLTAAEAGLSEQRTELETVNNITVSLQGLLDAADAKLKALDLESACVICMDKPRTICFRNCCHLVCCDTCTQNPNLNLCPICREPIIEKWTVFS